MVPLTPSFRRELRARAHALHPVVSIGHNGLTPPVLHEIDVALTAHELVKVRVQNDDRDEREALFGRIVDTLDCAPVQRIGKLFVLWRPRPPEPPAARETTRSTGRTRDAERHARPATAPPDRRRRASAMATAPTVPPRVRKPPPGKAPAGVPRAATRRRRRAA